MRGYRDVLAIRRYRWLWLGDTVSSLGDSVSFVALVWLVYDTSGSSRTLGWFLAAYTAPVLLGGPLVGCALVAAVGGANALWLDVASYAFFAVALWRMGPVSHPGADEPTRTSRSLRVVVGFLFRTPVILATTLMFMLVNVGEGILQVVMPVYVREVLGAGAGTYGALVSVAAAAGLVGALAAGLAPGRLPLGRAIAVSEILAGIAFAALAANPPLVVAFVFFALGSLFLGPLTVWAQTVRMRFIPSDMRGRAFGTLRTLMQSTVPLGALLAPLLLARGGVPAAALTVGTLLAVPALAALLSGMLDRDRPEILDTALGETARRSVSAPGP